MSFHKFNETEIEQQVLSFMRELDIEPYDERVILDGELHRYRTKDDRQGELSGAYCIHTDRIPAGFVQDWRKGIKTDWKISTENFTQEELNYFNSSEFKEKAERDRIQREQARANKQARAAEFSRQLWEQLKPAPKTHEYLKRKRIKNHGFKIQESRLAIPLRDIDGVLNSIQWIDTDGSKRFQPDAPLEKVFYSLGLETLKENPNQKILIGEGVATMAKVHELTNLPCVAAITCFALSKVSKIIRGRYEANKIFIMADDDKGTELRRGYNPGIREAKNVVQSGMANGYISPPFENPKDGTDWDDYAIKYGGEKTSQVIEKLLSEAENTARQEKYRAIVEKYGMMSGEDFETFCKPDDSEDFIIQDWLPSGGLVMLFAPSGSGKGFIALDMAFSVACRKITDWHGKEIIYHGSVVYLAGEGQRGMKKRCAALAAHKGINTKDVDMIIIKDALALDDKQPEYGIQKAIANIGLYSPKPALIIIDTANCYMSGDENKTVDATAFIRALKEIMQEFRNSTVMMIHHTGQNPDTQSRARGSSAFKAAMDMEYRVFNGGTSLTLEMTKSKDTEKQKPLVFNLVKVPAPKYFNALGEQETTCVLEYDANSSEINPQSSQPEKKISESEIFALRTYSLAAKKFGILLSDENYDRPAISVSLDDWRDVFYEMSSAEQSKTQRQRFHRARKLLLEINQQLFKKQIDGVEYYCLKPVGNGYEMEILIAIHQRTGNSNS